MADSQMTDSQMTDGPLESPRGSDGRLVSWVTLLHAGSGFLVHSGLNLKKYKDKSDIRDVEFANS